MPSITKRARCALPDLVGFENLDLFDAGRPLRVGSEIGGNGENLGRGRLDFDALDGSFRHHRVLVAAIPNRS